MGSLDGRTLVVFDGSCGFCNRTVRWALARDRRDRLRFVAYDSPRIEGLMKRHGLEPMNRGESPSTVIVVRDPEGPAEKVYLRSDAVVALLAELDLPWPAVSAVFALVPRPLRDLAYRSVAARRYRIAGRLTDCPLPSAQERSHFL